MKKSKMAETAKILDGMFRFIQGINLVAGSICLGGSLLISLGRQFGNVTTSDSITVTLGNIALEVMKQDTKMETQMEVYYQIMLTVRMIVAVIFLYAACRLVRQILEPMIEERPFDIVISKKLKTLGFLVLWWGILHNFWNIMQTEIEFRFYGLSNLIESEYVLSVNRNFLIDGTFFVVFLVLELVSYIFQYGAELQQLSDETI